eukprot:TRINITY_DN895_c0_g1_i1.p1 TRINITY_DN895_c0_g1~~TRINITY_DN895_c0_g1_i1.p1  ORF type:complete len:505 (-),score=146.89 TRINITY_DN895_c0_g1_i1:67-1548(-)
MKTILLIFILLLSYSLAVQPGVKTTLTQDALNYATQIGLEFVKQDLATIDIPDVSGKTNIDVGEVKYDITKIVLDDLQLPTFALNSLPNTGLELVLTNVAMHVGFDWHYSVWFASDSGSGDVQISGTDITVSISITNVNGYAHLNTESVNININNFNIDLHGGASWFYDLFLGLFKGDIKNSIQSAVKSNLASSINENANKAISSLPIKQNIGCCSYLDYMLTDDPRFTSTYFTVDELGEFFAINNPLPCPFPVPALPDSINTEMLQIFISDFSVTSAGYAEFLAEQLQFLITPQMVPKDSPFQLNTTDFSDLIPALYQKYPGLLMELNTSVYQMPQAVFNASGAFISAVTNIYVLVLPNNSSPILAFTLQVNVNLAGKANIKSSTIFGDLTFLSASISLYQTSIGNFSVSNLQDVVQLLIYGVLPIVNQKLSAGFQLPILDNVELVSPTLTFGQDYLAVTTNVQYTGAGIPKNANFSIPLTHGKPSRGYSKQ